ncbi:hypothetical protein AKJ16_DCAP09038 [Drosera capensis]
MVVLFEVVQQLSIENYDLARVRQFPAARRGWWWAPWCVESNQMPGALQMVMQKAPLPISLWNFSRLSFPLVHPVFSCSRIVFSFVKARCVEFFVVVLLIGKPAIDG